jgi:hypothetical protein
MLRVTPPFGQRNIAEPLLYLVIRIEIPADESLRSGVLIIGRNDLRHARPVPLAGLTSLARFDRMCFHPSTRMSFGREASAVMCSLSVVSSSRTLPWRHNALVASLRE